MEAEAALQRARVQRFHINLLAAAAQTTAANVLLQPAQGAARTRRSRKFAGPNFK
jgi:hypothetical protein